MIDFVPSYFLLTILFLSIVFCHLSKKNAGAIVCYAVQSVVIVCMLFKSFLSSHEVSLLIIALLMFIVKVGVGPVFLMKLIKKHALTFSVSTYLSTPLLLMIIAVLTGIAHSQLLAPITSLIPGNEALLSLSLASMLLSLFLIINRKGALSQLIGILFLENSIVAFATFGGLEQSLMLQIGIIFDVLVWIIIATVFVSMIYKHFGTLNVTSMKNLKD
jgi:hydrogenase-4 component E